MKEFTFKEGRDLFHLVSKFEDNKHTLYVFKKWNKRKQRWIYSVYEDYIIQYVHEMNLEILNKSLDI